MRASRKTCVVEFVRESSVPAFALHWTPYSGVEVAGRYDAASARSGG
jgi:hypothetical protein